MKLIPEAASFTTTSFAFGTGTGKSTSSITSGPPVCLTCMAFINVWILKNSLRNAGVEFPPTRGATIDPILADVQFPGWLAAKDAQYYNEELAKATSPESLTS
jgi:hypothetical protein